MNKNNNHPWKDVVVKIGGVAIEGISSITYDDKKPVPSFGEFEATITIQEDEFQALEQFMTGERKPITYKDIQRFIDRMKKLPYKSNNRKKYEKHNPIINRESGRWKKHFRQFNRKFKRNFR